ncbi:DUF4179 domain-containing protein [Sporosarcina sp. ACRSL]|uniref:DUF4179 domain-containing protein n=1 Tax=Sporosarcina sp. ACRSL TaxID=2918215 RepID=UPI001EF4CC97|nr:DUF4179 domain-containing protein [Sporosarcina sp. ACRSL]MCG7345289.1 DUF4179 domain-containing protein [Sporosarcina sp. ACRSL]
MNDKIPSFKREIDKIQVPVEKLDTIIDNVLDGEMPKRKRMVWQRMAIGTSGAVLSLGILLGSAAVSPAMAKFVTQIPIIGSIFSQSKDKGLVQVSETGLAQIIGETKTVNGKSLTIDELFYDGTRFTFSYSLASDVPITDNYLTPSWTIDGQQYASGMGRYDEVVISPSERTGIYELTYYQEETVPLKGKFELGLWFEGEDGEKWDFQIPVVKQADQRLITINEVQQLEDLNLKLIVTSIESGPGGMLLNYKIESPYDQHIASFIRFEVFDENGNEYKQNNGSATGSRYLKGNFLFDPIKDDATQLTINPIVYIPEDGTAIEVIGGEEFPINYSAYREKMYPFKIIRVKLSD